MEKLILSKLQEIEKTENVRILLAVESGRVLNGLLNIRMLQERMLMEVKEK